jgi:hypothetical protein
MAAQLLSKSDLAVLFAAASKAHRCCTLRHQLRVKRRARACVPDLCMHAHGVMARRRPNTLCDLAARVVRSRAETST